MCITRLLISLSALAVVLVTAFGIADSRAVATGSVVDPANFVAGVDNPFFPLEPGTALVYEGVKDGISSRDESIVTHNKKSILGVQTTVVRDRAFEDGVLVEETFDWYAQDRWGNVWYFGEDAKEFAPDGSVISTAGSWEAGVAGAEPGILMEAHPRVGDRYFQEVAPGTAEDQAQVLGLNKSQCVAFGCFDDLLMTKEWSRLDPGVVERKYYAKGVGFVLGVMVKGGEERIELVAVNH